jgi:hypothetical protein
MEGLYLVPGTTLVFYIFFSLKVVLGTKCSQQMFDKFLSSKNNVFEPVQMGKIRF